MSTMVEQSLAGKRALIPLTLIHRLQYVTARESSLFIFHALGKVLYSKRELPGAILSSSPILTFGHVNIQAGVRAPTTTRRTSTVKASSRNRRSTVCRSICVKSGRASLPRSIQM